MFQLIIFQFPRSSNYYSYATNYWNIGGEGRKEISLETGAAVINALSGVSPAGEDKDDGRRRREKGRHARNSRKFLTIQEYFSAISSTFTRTCVTRRRTCILPLIRPTSVNSSRMDKPSRKLTSGSRYTHTSAVQRAGELWTVAMKLMGKKKGGGGKCAE